MKFLNECPCFSCFCFIKKTKKSKPKEKDEKGSWSRFIHARYFSHCRNQSFVFCSKLYVVRFDDFLSKRLFSCVSYSSFSTFSFSRMPISSICFSTDTRPVWARNLQRKKEGQNPLAARPNLEIAFCVTHNLTS